MAARHEQMEMAGGFDHNFVLHGSSGALAPAATLRDPWTGRVLHIGTSEPGRQFYNGHPLDPWITTADGRVFNSYAGLCLEMQQYPGSPPHPHFPSVELRPGERCRSIIRWESRPTDKVAACLH